MPSTRQGFINLRKNPTNLTNYAGSGTGSQVDIKMLQIEGTTQLKKPQPENKTFPTDTSVHY